MKIEFVDDAQQDEFLGNKQGVPELEETEDDASSDSDSDTDTDTDASSKGGDDIYSNIEDMDLFIAKFLLAIIDDTRATWLSTWAWGDIEHSDKYRYYKNIDDKQHKAMVMAAAYVVRKYRLSKSPEVILLIGLAVSTFMVWQVAKADRKERIAQQEAEREEKERQKQEQEESKKRYQEQHPKGRIININNKKQSVFI